MERRLKNSEDRHIAPSGTPTRVYAKNLMVSDTVVLAGDTTGVVTRVKTLIRRNGTVVTSYTIRRSNRKTFSRLVDGYTRVWIVEYPSTRFDRRAMSRVSNADRPHYQTI